MSRQAAKYYIQDEFRDPVKFCRERDITPIPASQKQLEMDVHFHPGKRYHRVPR